MSSRKSPRRWERRLTDFDPATGAAVFDVQSGRGSSLWTSTQAGKAPKRVAEANAHLHDVATPAMKSIQYEDLKGRKLHGWLVLPPRFNSDRHWPLVAHVYPGTVFSDQAKPWLDDDSELLAGHGYVVLLPSMPREPALHSKIHMTHLRRRCSPRSTR